MLINHAKLGIEDVSIQLPATTTSSPTNAAIQFLPGTEVPFDVPFGKCVFLDPIFLPGTVTLEIGGHLIEMMPRQLTVDTNHYRWEPGLAVVIEKIEE